MIMWKSISGSNDCLTYGSKLLMLVYCSCLMLLYGFRCYQFSVIYNLQNLEPLWSAGVVLIGAWLDTLLSIEVLLSIHVFYKQFLVYITPGHQVLRICYKYCLNIISWRLTRSGRNVLYRSKKHQNGRRHLLIITPSEADHVFIVHPWPHILTT